MWRVESGKLRVSSELRVQSSDLGGENDELGLAILLDWVAVSNIRAANIVGLLDAAANVVVLVVDFVVVVDVVFCFVVLFCAKERKPQNKKIVINENIFVDIKMCLYKSRKFVGQF